MGGLIELTLSAFEAEVASDSPAPGGGSVSAGVGGMGAGLIAMVCRLSQGGKKVQASDEELAEALEESERLRLRFLELVDEDTEAFNAIMTAVRMPKEDEVQRSAQAAAMEEATFGATGPPLETLATARRTLELAASLAGRTKASCMSDLGVAVEMARAAAEGALLNVATNLEGMDVDDRVVKLRQESQTHIEAARAAAGSAASTIGDGVGLGELGLATSQASHV
jgi:formiminotetrahydrofolate cyclodeaminase